MKRIVPPLTIALFVFNTECARVATALADHNDDWLMGLQQVGAYLHSGGGQLLILCISVVWVLLICVMGTRANGRQ